MASLKTHQQMVKIVGMTDLQKTLTETMPKEARRILRRTVTVIARGVRDDMRDTVRKQTNGDGTLRKAIRSKRERGQRDHQEAAVYITHGKAAKKDAYYWHFVEFGTVKAPENPFIRPNVKVWEGKLDGEFRRHFGDEFEKEMAKRGKK